MNTAQPIAFLSVERKALTAVEARGGDLIIEGFAARFTGTDREHEQFTETAFASTIERAAAGTLPLAFHHKHDQIIGAVIELRVVKGVGLWMRGRVDGAIASNPVLSAVYEQIKRGTLNALSVGGFFTRGLGALANKIVGVDATEISVTGVPVMAPGADGTSFAVAAGKALGHGSLGASNPSNARSALLSELRQLATASPRQRAALKSDVSLALLQLSALRLDTALARASR